MSYSDAGDLDATTVVGASQPFFLAYDESPNKRVPDPLWR